MIEEGVGVVHRAMFVVPVFCLTTVRTNIICLFSAGMISSGPVSHTKRMTERWRHQWDVIDSILQNTTVWCAECFRLQHDFVLVFEKLKVVIVEGLEDKV
jgi:hypothetical protein